MILEKKTIGGFNVIGLSIRTDNAEGKAADHINALWQMFYEEDALSKITRRVDDTIYAVYSDYEGDHTKPYRFTIGCRVEDDSAIPDNMDLRHIPKAQYACAKARGEQPRALIEKWQDIWGSDLKRRFEVDFEIYGPDFFDPEKREVPIYLSLKDDA